MTGRTLRPCRRTSPSPAPPRPIRRNDRRHEHPAPGGGQLQPFDPRRWRGCHKIHIRPGFRFPRLPVDRPQRRQQLRAQFRLNRDVANPNFLTRMDKYEITYAPGSRVRRPRPAAPISARPIFLASPCSCRQRAALNRKRSPGTTTTPSTRPRSSRPSAPWRITRPTRSANTLGALVANGANGVTINTPGGPMNGVVRIIAPSSTNRRGSTPYPSFGNYAEPISRPNADLGQHRGSERTIPERRTVPEL